MNPRLRGLGLGRVHVQLAAHVDDMLPPKFFLRPRGLLHCCQRDGADRVSRVRL